MPNPPQALVDHVAWAVVLDHWPQILTLVMVSLMGVLMQASVIEIAARADVDLNQELRTLGIGNAVCALAGSLPGYHSLSTTLLADPHEPAGRGWSRSWPPPPLRCCSSTAAAPSPTCRSWSSARCCSTSASTCCWRALLNPHLRRVLAEFAVAMLVCATVAFVGLLEGLAVGVAAGIVLFVIKYSQVDVVRRATHGRRASQQRRALGHAPGRCSTTSATAC